MRKVIAGLVGAALVLLTGCIVTSVYPFYTAKDVSFEPALLGTWSDPDKPADTKDVWRFEKIADQTYQLTVQDENETNQFDAHLFGLGGQKFIDCFSRKRADYQTPTHVLLRVQQLEPQLELQTLDYKWLGNFLEKNPKALRHIVTPSPAGEGDKEELLTLTANTEELQKFVRQHLANTNAWEDAFKLRKR